MKKERAIPPIIGAASRGDIAALARLLREDPDSIRARSSIGITPLNAAASQGQLAACELLLRHGADVNATDDDGRTPLHDAALAGSAPVLKLLLANGADPARLDKRGKTPLAAAIGNVEVGRPESEEVVQLLKAVAGPDDLSSAVMEADTGRVRAILAADPQAVKAHRDPGELLLTAVVRKQEAGSTEIVELLLSHGADPNKPPRGWPQLPIEMADTETAELLVKYGAKGPKGHRPGRK